MRHNVPPRNRDNRPRSQPALEGYGADHIRHLDNDQENIPERCIRDVRKEGFDETGKDNQVERGNTRKGQHSRLEEIKGRGDEQENRIDLILQLQSFPLGRLVPIFLRLSAATCCVDYHPYSPD